CSHLLLTELILNSLPLLLFSFQRTCLTFFNAARFGDFIRLSCRNPCCQQLSQKTLNRFREAINTLVFLATKNNIPPFSLLYNSFP
ncbi:hypothetical protein, partial [Fictibacillus halophilus]|uniref:hypothetical protein n=1 Tax=Fictibacillus halophilus TaxID=1610490 RepID=UPI001CFB0C3D